MKIRCTILLVAIALVGLGCRDEKSWQAGHDAAEKFVAAWQGNSEQARVAAAIYGDGAQAARGRADYDEAFLQAVSAHGNDTLTTAAQLLALNSADLCEATAKPIVDGLLAGALQADDARHRVNLIHAVMEWLKRSPAQWNQDIQGLVDNLPTGDQMKVYCAIASPSTLGAALRADQDRGQDVTAQVAALKTIYTPEQMADFNKSFRSTK